MLVVFDYQEIELCSGGKQTRTSALPAGQVIHAESVPQLLLITPSACNKLYKRSFWEMTQIVYPEGRNFEDLSVIPRILLQAGRVVYLEGDPLYFYVLREGSIMRSGAFEKGWEERRKAISDVRNLLEEKGMEQQYKKELEYLAFEHLYFVPSKEVVLKDRNNPCLKEWRSYLDLQYPDWKENPVYPTVIRKRQNPFIAAQAQMLCRNVHVVCTAKRDGQAEKQVTGDKNGKSVNSCDSIVQCGKVFSRQTLESLRNVPLTLDDPASVDC